MSEHASGMDEAREGQPVRLIVNADDLGRDAATNEATFTQIEAGRVTSATVMAAGEGLDEAAAQSRNFPRCSFGAHLSLTELKPLAPHPDLDFLVGPDGSFANRREALCRKEMLTRRATADAIYSELAAQVLRLQGLGIHISHLDSHHHAHTIGQILPVIKRLQKTFAIPRIRIRMNLFDDVTYRAGPVWRLKTWLLNQALRRVHDSVTTDWFTSLGAFTAPAAHGEVRPGSSVELMVHPGHPHCEEENALLETDWIARLPFPVRLISYLELDRERTA